MVERLERNYQTAGVGARAGAAVDQGLRAYMLHVYNYMASGVLLTGIVALLTYNTPALMQAIYGTPLMWVVMLAPLAFIFILSARFHKFSVKGAQAMFWAFAGVMGLSMSTIFIAYTGMSIAKVFFITAASFAGLSLYGYTTKTDLSAFRSFLVVGLIGVIIAMLVNWFLQSAMMDFVISIVGVLVFAGLTAYDTQAIRQSYYLTNSGEMRAKTAVLGALRLYLDFINMFLFLLRLFGSRD